MESYSVGRYKVENRLKNCRSLLLRDQIRLFQIESRNYQTLHYNFLRLSEQITFKNNPRNEFNERVRDYILQSVSIGETTNEEVETLSSFISSKCSLNDNLVITIVWVYFFEFETYQMQSYPVFKIKLNDNAYTFIDWNKNEHSSWSKFLDNNDLTVGFICVPQNGTYEWSNEYNHLSLEFCSTKAAYDNRPHLRCAHPFNKSLPPISKIKFWVNQLWNNLQLLGSQAVVGFWNFWEEIKSQGSFSLVVVIGLSALASYFEINGGINNSILKKFTNELLQLFSCRSVSYSDAASTGLSEYFNNFKKIFEAWSVATAGNDLSEWKKLGVLILQALQPIANLSTYMSRFLPQSSLLLSAAQIITLFTNLFTKINLLNQIDYGNEKDATSFSHYEMPSQDHNYSEQMYDDVLRRTRVDEQKNITQCKTEAVSVLRDSSQRGILKFIAFTNNEYSEVMTEIRKIVKTDFTLHYKGNYSIVTDQRGNDLGIVGFNDLNTFGVFFL